MAVHSTTPGPINEEKYKKRGPEFMKSIFSDPEEEKKIVSLPGSEQHMKDGLKAFSESTKHDGVERKEYEGKWKQSNDGIKPSSPYWKIETDPELRDAKPVPITEGDLALAFLSDVVGIPIGEEFIAREGVKYVRDRIPKYLRETDYFGYEIEPEVRAIYKQQTGKDLPEGLRRSRLTNDGYYRESPGNYRKQSFVDKTAYQAGRHGGKYVKGIKGVGQAISLKSFYDTMGAYNEQEESKRKANNKKRPMFRQG